MTPGGKSHSVATLALAAWGAWFLATVAMSSLLGFGLAHILVVGVMGGLVAVAVWYVLYRATAKYR